MVSDEEARAIVRGADAGVRLFSTKTCAEIGGEPSKTPLDLGLKQQ